MARIMIPFFLLASMRLTSCQTVTSLQPDTAVRVLPGNMDLFSFTFLICQLELSSLTASGFVSRWTLPSGQTFTFNQPNPPGFEQFRVTQGPVAIEGGVGIATLLFISNLTYQSAGNYTCEVRGSSTPPQSPWLLATSVLQLEVSLQANGSSVTARSNDSDVELRCEMTLYIRADEDLQWFSGSMMITSGTNRHTVSYRNGTASAAQNGGNALVPGRVSVLTISRLQQSDSGTYSCRILGTEQSADIQLNVIPIQQGVLSPTTSIAATPTGPRTAATHSTTTLSTNSTAAIPTDPGTAATHSTTALSTTSTAATPTDPGTAATNSTTALPTGIVAVIIVVGLIILSTNTVTTVIIILFVVKRKSFKITANEAYGKNVHRFETVTVSPTDAQAEGLGPNQPTSGEEEESSIPAHY